METFINKLKNLKKMKTIKTKLMLAIFMLIMTFGQVNAQEQEIVEAITNAGEKVETATETIYSDGKEAISTVYEDSKSMISDLYPDVKSAISQLAQGLGTASTEVFEILTVQFTVMAVKQLTLLIILSIILILCIRGINKKLSTKCEDHWEDVSGNIKFGLNVLVALIICMVLPLSINFDEMFTGLINPKYGAINYIIEYAREFIE